MVSVDGTGTTNLTKPTILSCFQIISKINNNIPKHQREKEDISSP